MKACLSLLALATGEVSFDDTTLFPRVDMSRPLNEVVEAVTKAASVGGPGFFYLVNHGIEESVFDDAVREAHKFFMQDLEQKQAISAIGYGGGPAPTKGYVQPAAEGEYAKDASDVRPESERATGQRNLRESFVLRYPERGTLSSVRFLDDYDDFLQGLGNISEPGNRVASVEEVEAAANRFFLPNQWPAAPEFRPAVERFMAEELRLSRKVFELFAGALASLGSNATLPSYTDGMMTANIAHYSESHSEGFGIADHTDWEMFTLLKPKMLAARHVDYCQGEASSSDCTNLQEWDRRTNESFSTGLEVWFEERWVSVPVLPDAILVNQGEMLSRLSGGRFKAPVHRVRAESPSHRYSLISFWGLDFDAELPDPDTPCGKILAGEHYLNRNGFFKSLTV